MFAVKGIIDERELELCLSELIEAGTTISDRALFLVWYVDNWVRFTFRVFE